MQQPPFEVDSPPMRTGVRTVAITGASGSLGRELLRCWHRRGAALVALSHGDRPLQLSDADGQPIPLRQVRWQVGREVELEGLLRQVDVLVLNHGVNVHAARDAAAVERSLEVNALSAWRLMELYAAVAPRSPDGPKPELWLNTSEAEIQPAFSPLYEISKRLAGQLLSLRALDLGGPDGPLRLRRLVLGPFRSELNPHGPMAPGWVAAAILWQAELGLDLIIVTINPLVVVVMPLVALARRLYLGLFSRSPDR
ncbi:MAG: short-chain dehydrogenase [Cyanobacteriota bacterium]|nr:short-chain dehydrogenase [Cyanobacteriota bacterium]